MRSTLFIGAGVVVLLMAFASGYGYHRDELYFLAAGHHLAWSYADQGPITPLIARGMSSLSAHSLTLLRLPSALTTGGTVVLTGGLARELGGEQRAVTIAAVCAAAGGLVLFTGHLLSTSTFDLFVWTAISFLAVRAIRTGDDRLWLVAGLVLGVGLLNKPLPAFLAGGFLLGVLIAGPRRLLSNRYVWAGTAIALALWSPWVVWQARHGWPQIDVSRSIANGGSASSQPWWSIVPFQFLLISPVLAPVWVAGLVRLFRDPAVRDYRFIAWAWVVLAIVFMATGGKPYYLGGLLPLLLGAGAAPVDRWLRRGRSRARERTLVAAIVLGGAVSALVDLPLLPAGSAGPVVALNSDVAETIGWPDLVRTVSRVYGGLTDPHGTVLFTRNYGEAGAIDRYGPALGLPRAYSGHNAFGTWGPPPDGQVPVITVGLTWRDARAHFRSCRSAARIDNHAGIDNDERDALVLVCAAPRQPWSREWRALRHLG